jgi:transposase-like protein
MSINQVQFQEGYSLFEFFDSYGTDEQCRETLFKWKFPDGFICPECGSTTYCNLTKRNLYQCNHCHHQTSATCGTIFDSTKLPLNIWFLAIHLMTQMKTAISALELKRQLKVSYKTAWSIKQKIMQVMKERDDSKPLSGIIQMDDVYWGGEHRGGSRGRGSENKTSFVAAVSTNEEGHPISMNFNVVKGFKSEEIERWAKKHVESGSTVYSDGLNCFPAVEKAGCKHIRYVTGGGPKSVDKPEFIWVNTMIGNVKNAMRGSYHSINPRHLPRYLGEFCYRFNRRFDLKQMMPRFLSVATRTPPMPGKLLKLAELYG